MRRAVAVLLFLCASAMYAPEKGAIARVADLIVVGYFHDLEVTARTNGFALRGKILVAYTLHGSQPSGVDIEYLFNCSDCPMRSARSVTLDTHGQRLWFLTDQQGDQWGSAGPSDSDPGWRSMHEMDYYLDLLRKLPK